MKKQTKTIAIAMIILAVYLVGIIGFASADLTVKSVVASPDPIEPGKKTTLEVNLENNMNDDAENVAASLDLTSVPFSPVTTSSDFLDEILEGDDGRVFFDLIADPSASAGNYKIPLAISYQIGNTTFQQKTFVAVGVNAKPAFGLNSQNVLLKNQKNTIQIKITNTGLAQAKFLDIQINPSASYDILSADDVYIGDLNSDDFDTASFDLYLKDSSTIIVPLTLTYRDSANNQYTESDSLVVRAYSQSEAIQLGLVTPSYTGYYILAVIILIVIYFIYRAIRNRRKKNRERR